VDLLARLDLVVERPGGRTLLQLRQGRVDEAVTGARCWPNRRGEQTVVVLVRRTRYGGGIALDRPGGTDIEVWAD
jgi:hypothetical protein